MNSVKGLAIYSYQYSYSVLVIFQLKITSIYIDDNEFSI